MDQPCRSPCTHVTFTVSLTANCWSGKYNSWGGGGGGRERERQTRQRERSVDSEFKLSVFTSFFRTEDSAVDHILASTDPHTHTQKVKKNAIHLDNTQQANFRGNALFQAPTLKQQLNGKKERKDVGYLSVDPFCYVALCLEQCWHNCQSC